MGKKYLYFNTKMDLIKLLKLEWGYGNVWKRRCQTCRGNVSLAAWGKIYSFETSYFDYIFASKCQDKCDWETFDIGQSFRVFGNFFISWRYRYSCCSCYNKNLTITADRTDATTAVIKLSLRYLRCSCCLFFSEIWRLYW